MMKKKTLNILLSIEIISCQGKFYLKRAKFFLELAKHFDVTLHSRIVYREEVCDQYYELHSLNVSPLEESLRLKPSYVKRINGLRSQNELIFVLFPVRSLDFFLVRTLCRYPKLIVWVKANTIEYKLSFLKRYSFSRFLFPPSYLFFSSLYSIFMGILLKKSLVFYTGDITFSRRNHMRQYSMVSSTLERDEISFKPKTSIQRKKILYVGNISFEKGVFDLLEAVKDLPDYTLTVVGNGIALDQCKKMYDKYSNIFFTGAQYNRSKLLEIYDQNGILVMPSHSEKQGKVYLEAMARGLVPIVTDVGGVHTIIKNMYNGLMVKSASPKDLRDSLLELSSHKKLFDSLQKNGQRTIVECTFEKQINFMKEVILNTFFK